MQTGIGGEDEEEGIHSRGLENEHPEPRGPAREGWKTGEKRKDPKSKQISQKPKKRRKLVYPTLGTNMMWVKQLTGWKQKKLKGWHS